MSKTNDLHIDQLQFLEGIRLDSAKSQKEFAFENIEEGGDCASHAF